MTCLDNISYNKIPNDIIMRYLDLYQFIGRNDTMLKIIEDDYEALTAATIRTDSYFFAQLIGLKISESRYKQLIVRDVKPKTNDEAVLRNIKRAFQKIHGETDSFTLFSREIQDLLKFLYKDAGTDTDLNFAKTVKKPKASINLLSSGKKTKRDELESLIQSYENTKKKNQYEASFININFYLDFIQLEPFKKHNDTLAHMLHYILLIHDDFKAFHLSSFFEKLYKRREVFEKLFKDASHNYKEGLADTHDLHRFILDIALESYRDISEILRNYTFDQQLNKSDYIENTINRLPEVFTKEMIRNEHPTISESTINRTLKRLRDDKKIRPLGKGRSAKWMKLYPTQKKPSLNEQLNLKL